MKLTIDCAKIQDFANYLRNEERSDATIEKYLRDVRFFLHYAKARMIDKQLILDYKTELGIRFAVSSANSMIAALNTFLRFCGCCDLCVKQFKVQRQPYCPEEKELTRAEYVRLLNAATARNNQKLNLIIQTICGTGIRVSELQFITVEALQRGEASVCCKGKSRRIFIVPSLKKKLLRYIKEQKIRSGPVFVTCRGTPISRHSIWKAMKALCKQANVLPGKVFPHNLRHLFARSFYEIEKDMAKLADLLGHASINTTRLYIVTTGAEHKKKMEHMRLII